MDDDCVGEASAQLDEGITGREHDQLASSSLPIVPTSSNPITRLQSHLPDH
jgi:hypothetical protein